jgi:dihydroorotate dehydrogenase electron transfer subunit
VIDNRPLMPGGFLITIELEGAMPVPHAGQFVQLRIDGAPLLRRPFSVLGYRPARDASGARIELMYAVVGAGTRLLEHALPGARLGVLGPLGNGFDPGDTKDLILVAGGRGAVPLLRLLESGEVADRRVLYLAGAASADFIWGLDRLHGAEHRIATVDGSRGERGTVIDLLDAALAERRGREAPLVLACGPEAMLRRVAETALRSGVPSQVALENRMGCGIGICRGCVIRRRVSGESPWPRDGNASYATVCKEGPVFLSDEVDWAAMAESQLPEKGMMRSGER